MVDNICQIYHLPDVVDNICQTNTSAALAATRGCSLCEFYFRYVTIPVIVVKITHIRTLTQTLLTLIHTFQASLPILSSSTRHSSASLSLAETAANRNYFPFQFKHI